MRLKKLFFSFIFIAVLVLTGVNFAGAAGLGTVNMGYLEQQHPNYQQSVAAYQNYAAKYQAEYVKQAKGKSEEQKKQLQQYYHKQLEGERLALFTLIDEDIQVKIKQVKDAKNLDYVVLQGSVVFGTYVDITQDVAAAMSGTYKF